MIGAVILGLISCESTAVRPAPESTPIFDKAIIPGQRVGPISLCITEAQLYSVMGSPSYHSTRERSGDRLYNYGSTPTGERSTLIAWAGKRTGRIYQVTVKTSDYATPEGIAIGASALEVRAKLGHPRRVTPDGNDTVYDYDGLTLEIDGSGIWSLFIHRDC
jgi:hypothetical protein